MEQNKMNTMLLEMVERFETLSVKADENKDYECEFNCLNIIMGIKSNMIQQEEIDKQKEESLKEQIMKAKENNAKVIEEKLKKGK